MTRFVGLKKVCSILIFFGLTRIATAQTFTSLFTLDYSEGQWPAASLVQGKDGALYGTTEWGGWNLSTGKCSAGCGTIFRITPSGAFVVLHRFSGHPTGSHPLTSLTLATDGAFYGKSQDTVFRMTTKGKVTTIYEFFPPSGQAGLTQGTDGEFYSTTAFGGFYGDGNVFKISADGALVTLHDFDGQGPDGYFPAASVIQSTDGNFYGTTIRGGLYDAGTAYKITPSGELTTLHSFGGDEDNASPFAALVEGLDGDFYGTTAVGDFSCLSHGACGTVYRITPHGELTTLHTFHTYDGGNPWPALIQATDGNFYGVASTGGLGCGNKGCGTIFRMTPDGKFTTLHFFTDDVNYPGGGLLQATNGVLYGTTTFPPTVFSLDVGLGPFVAFVRDAGRVGGSGGILGQGFTGTTTVTLNGTPAQFEVVSDTFIRATVPPGATAGYVTVTTPTGMLKSNVQFHVIP